MWHYVENEGGEQFGNRVVKAKSLRIHNGPQTVSTSDCRVNSWGWGRVGGQGYAVHATVEQFGTFALLAFS